MNINVDRIGICEALIDTGADLSVVDLSTALNTGLEIINPDKMCSGPDGKELDIVGNIILNIKFDDKTITHQFVIMRTHLRIFILGRDFLKKMNAKIDCQREIIKYDLTENRDVIKYQQKKIKSAKDAIIPELSIKLINAFVEAEDGEYIIEENHKMFQTNGLRLARSLINVVNKETYNWITNPYPRPLKILKNQTLCFGSQPAEVNLMEESEQKEHEEPQFQINENLAYKEKEQLKQVLERYEDLFSSGLGRSNLAKHRIDTEGAKPIKHKPYRVSAKEREIIKEQIDEMLRDGIIRPSSSPWSFPVILVKKRDGKYRFCVDYRKLNDVTVKDVYPIPRIDEVLDTLQGSKYFSAIDLKSGYWQVEVEEKDKEKTAFTTAHGLYEFNVMPFGLCNAPATFERNMENMLGILRWQICLCYLDDVIIYSSDFSTYLKRIEAVLKCFREANLKLNNKKCQFAFEELEILGHITNQHGIKPAEHNIKAIRDFPRPKKIEEVQSLKFIKGFSKIADPLTSLIKKNVHFTWTENQEKAFQTLKVALINPPILGHFDPNAITYIHTDASNIGLGATLVQKFGDKEKVISYLSRTLSKPEQNYSTTEKECLAVVWSMSKIGIDFVGPLPSTKRRRKWIIVLTDYYTKYAETKAASEATVKEVSTFLIEHIILRHGAPRFLISDRGSQFTSNLMKEVMKMCKVKHCFTTSYHPQTNGLTERLNRTLINMISMYVNTDQKNWDEILPFITHAYNTTIQETTGYSPFFLLFGREPMSLLDDENIPTDSNMDDYDEYIENYLDKIARTRQVVINNTEKTQERMKRNYDKKHNEKIYEPGHLVAVWTPVRKIGKCEKLLRKYFGPYRILKKLSNVNYLIEPKDNPGQDPLIVHVSRLKPYFERIDEVAKVQKQGSGLGISLEGTVDLEDGREVRPHHYIRTVLPQGAVGRCGLLRPGDELLE
ncbi:K02A2.6-like, partial [Cordylochernes scorpioides]